VAALALQSRVKEAGQRGRTAAEIAHGIEALACKLEYHSQSGSDRIIGVRAFSRDGQSSWEYAQLRTRAHYVQNTYRQVAVRALGMRAGLAFTQGPRFNSMRLTDVGQVLARAFLEQPAGAGRQKLEGWLEQWIKGRSSSWGDNLAQALSPARTSGEERRIVWERLVGTGSKASTKRRKLAEEFLKRDEFPDIEKELLPALRKEGAELQAEEISLARCFGRALSSAQRILALLTVALKKERALSGGDAATRGSIRSELKRLREATLEYQKQEDRVPHARDQDAAAFASEVARLADGELLEKLVLRDRQVLQLSDGEIHQGPLFRVIEEDEGGEGTDRDATSDPDARSDKGRTFRLANLFSLVKDCHPGSLP
jgi:hypothetical protein